MPSKLQDILQKLDLLQQKNPWILEANEKTAQILEQNSSLAQLPLANLLYTFSPLLKELYQLPQASFQYLLHPKQPRHLRLSTQGLRNFALHLHPCSSEEQQLWIQALHLHPYPCLRLWRSLGHLNQQEAKVWAEKLSDNRILEFQLDPLPYMQKVLHYNKTVPLTFWCQNIRDLLSENHEPSESMVEQFRRSQLRYHLLEVINEARTLAITLHREMSTV